LSSLNVIRLDENFVTNFEVWRWGPSFVGGGGIAFLCFRDCFLEFLVEFVKIYYEVSYSCGGEVLFRMYRDVQVVSLVAKKGDIPVVALGALLYVNSTIGRSSDQLSCW